MRSTPHQEMAPMMAWATKAKRQDRMVMIPAPYYRRQHWRQSHHDGNVGKHFGPAFTLEQIRGDGQGQGRGRSRSGRLDHPADYQHPDPVGQGAGQTGRNIQTNTQ